MSTNPENTSPSADPSIVQRVRNDFLRRVLDKGRSEDLNRVAQTFGPAALVAAGKLRPSEDLPG